MHTVEKNRRNNKKEKPMFSPIFVLCFSYFLDFWVSLFCSWPTGSQMVILGQYPQYGWEPREGGAREGGVAQIARQICANCRYFVSCIRGRVRKTVANLSRIWRSISDNFMQIPLFQCPLLQISDSTAGTFRKKFRKISEKTPETLSELFLEFPSTIRLGTPKWQNPLIQGMRRLQSISRIICPQARFKPMIYHV